MTRLPAFCLAAWWLAGHAQAGEPPVRVSLLESRLCLPRKSIDFVVQNVSPDIVHVGLSVERQTGSGDWIFFQESVATPWTSKVVHARPVPRFRLR